MGTTFEGDSLADLMHWVRQDRKKAEKIYSLINDHHGPQLALNHSKKEWLAEPSKTAMEPGKLLASWKTHGRRGLAAFHGAFRQVAGK